ncbi:MAG: hypothetical protein STHCBS139747_000464 [Sporothrix thermara]
MIETIDWDKDIVSGFLDDTAYSDAFHSSWGHGMVSPGAASIFARVRAIQLQRRMHHSQRTASRRVTLPSFAGISHMAVRRRTTIKEQNRFEDEEIWRTLSDDDGGDKAADPSLINVLARFKWTLATDPRDKVYGLMGLVAEAPLLPPVDYTLPAARVYSDAALAIIQTSGSLDLISQNPFEGADGDISDGSDDTSTGGVAAVEDGNNRRAPHLPSWSPNFDRSSYTDYFDEFATILFAQRGIYAAGKPDCKHLFPLDVQDGWVDTSGYACGQDEARRPVRSLRLRGTVIGRIAPLKQGAWEENSQEYTSVASNIERLYQLKAHYCGAEDNTSDTKRQNEVYAPTGEDLWDAFWRTIVGDCTAYPIRRLTAIEQAQCSAGLAEVCRLREAEVREIEEATRHFTTDEEWAEYHDEQRYKAPSLASKLLCGLPIQKMLRRMLRRWSMAQTLPDGRSPGGAHGLLLMVRSSAQPGDVVAVLDGSKVPVVLRGQDATIYTKDGKPQDATFYKYVCPAYVHGYMNGEAVAQVADGRLVEQDFVLV